MRRWKLPLIGASLGLLLIGVGGFLIRWENPRPDQILVYHGPPGLYAIAPEKNWVRPLTPPDSQYTFHLHTSADNQWVYYANGDGYESSNLAIYRISMLSGDPQKIAETTNPESIQFAPNGKWLIYERQDTGFQPQLVKSNVDGSGLMVLTGALDSTLGLNIVTSHVEISPDSEWIFFNTYAHGYWDVLRVRHNGQDIALLMGDINESVTLGEIDPARPDWITVSLPDGLYEMRLDGTERRFVGPPPPLFANMTMEVVGSTPMTTPNGKFEVQINSDSDAEGYHIRRFDNGQAKTLRTVNRPTAHPVLVGFTQDSEWLIYRVFDITSLVSTREVHAYQIRLDGGDHQPVEFPDRLESSKPTYQRINWYTVREKLWQGVVGAGFILFVLACLPLLKTLRRGV